MTEIYDTEYAMNEFHRCGEIQLMDKLSEFELKTIFDVGANIGEWTKMALARNPDAVIHAFEPMPCVFKKALSNINLDRVYLNSFGLSSKLEFLNMLYDGDNDRLTTPCLELIRTDPKVLPLLMVDGDSYCCSREIESIDFIKIDTEGHEYKVLQGLSNLISNKKIDIIQFEYGYANVLTKDLLIDFYRMLIPHGYIIGKLLQDGVDFKTYGLTDEDFKGPNYVAVHESKTDIISKIQAASE